MKKIKKLGFYTSLLTASALLAACGGTEATTGTNSESHKTGTTEESTTENVSTKDTVSWMTMLHTPTPPSGEVESLLEEHTGMNIEFNWVPDASKEERINAALASNTLTDIVSLTQMTNTTVRQALGSGMFWDVEPYLSEYENLSKINQATIDGAKVNGHLYGIPVQKPLARYGILVRQDWLDNLGLEEPKTIDELREVARAFTEDDPDGNGIDDTVGFADRAESVKLGFRNLTGYFGAGNNFYITEENEVVPSFMQPEFKEAMAWYRDIYENGWMNSDFAVMAKNDQKDYIAAGKAGLVSSTLSEANNYKMAANGTNQENVMEWALINDITHKDVPVRAISDTGNGVGGVLAIPKSNVETEEDLRVVLQFINDLMDEEAFTLMTQGIEGKHYEISDEGVYSRLDDTSWQQEVQPYASSRPSELVTTFKSASELTNIANEKIEENAEYVVIDPSPSLNSETYTTQWSSLVEGVDDAYYRYMMGDIEMADFDAAIKAFLNSGGQAVIDEFTASYAENN